jgi:branched-chain amino acid transport system permease protein
MLGAFVAWMGLRYCGVGYWLALLLTPAVVGLLGIVFERLCLRRLYRLDPLYGLLLTFGLALVLEGIFQNAFGISGNSYPVPTALQGGTNLGFMYLPRYRAWVVLVSMTVCFGSWFVIEKTRLGAYLRAGTENPALLQGLGVNVPLMFSLTYGYGVALAAFAGVMAAPLYQVTPLMGSSVIIVVFAVVVIGGMGSILGSILTGLGLGLVEGLTKFVYPQASDVVVFVVMAFVLLLRPAGLFGKQR